MNISLEYLKFYTGAGERGPAGKQSVKYFSCCIHHIWSETMVGLWENWWLGGFVEGFQKLVIISQYGKGHLQTSFSVTKYMYHRVSIDSWDVYK